MPKSYRYPQRYMKNKRSYKGLKGGTETDPNWVDAIQQNHKYILDHNNKYHTNLTPDEIFNLIAEDDAIKLRLDNLNFAMANPVSGFPPSELLNVLEERKKYNMIGKLRSLLNVNDNDSKEKVRHEILDYNEGKEGARHNILDHVNITGNNLFTHRLIYGAILLLTIFIIIGIVMVSYRI